MHSVKRVFGGFAVVNEAGDKIQTFDGQGAKASATAHANELNGGSTDSTQAVYGARGGSSRGGSARGGN